MNLRSPPHLRGQKWHFKIWINIEFVLFSHKFCPNKKLYLVKRKCQKFQLKLVVKSAMLATILKNQLFFVSAVVHISTAHITTVTMDDVVCLERRSRRASFSYFSQPLSANSTQYKSFRVELKMANSKWTYSQTPNDLHPDKTDTSIKRTPNFGPCHFFESFQYCILSLYKTDTSLKRTTDT